MEMQTQPRRMTILISDDGKLYASLNDRLYELELGPDVTDDMISDLEIIKVYSPADMDAQVEGVFCDSFYGDGREE